MSRIIFKIKVRDLAILAQVIHHFIERTNRLNLADIVTTHVLQELREDFLQKCVKKRASLDKQIRISLKVYKYKSLEYLLEHIDLLDFEGYTSLVLFELGQKLENKGI